MPDFPVNSDNTLLATGGSVGTNAGTVVTGGAPNVKGSYSTLCASTAFDANGFWLNVNSVVSASSGDCLLDVAVGAAASEVVVISNFAVTTNVSPGANSAFFPVRVPAGTRISARVQSTAGGSGTVNASVVMAAGSYFDPIAGNVVDTYGANTVDSGGTSIDPGAVAGTKGTAVQMTAATTRPHNWLVVAFGNQTQSARSNTSWLVDVMVGPATETVVIPDLMLTSGNSRGLQPQGYSFPLSIPTGTRLSVKASCTDTNATTRLFDIILYGCS